MHPEHGHVRNFFPIRNRIISGLSLGVLVVEAPEKSGAMITAQRALDQGRDVFALPANLGQVSGSGNLQLLRDGAILVRDAWEVLEEYTGRFPGILQMRDYGDLEDVNPASEPEPETAPAPAPARKKDVDKTASRNYIDTGKIMQTLQPEEQHLVKLLENGPIHIDALSEQMGQPTGNVLALLTMLEVKGLIRHLPGRKFSLAEAE